MIKSITPVHNLHREYCAQIPAGEPITAPGIPKNCPDAEKLVTEDCVKSQPSYPLYEPSNPTPLRKPVHEQAEADAAHSSLEGGKPAISH